MKSRFSTALLLLILVVAGGTAVYLTMMPDDLEQQQQNRLILQLQWIPTSQFLGVYVAVHEDYFQREGLNVELLHGGPNVDPLRRLVDGDCNVALATADQVVRRDAEARAGSSGPDAGLKALATIFDRSVAVFMFHDSAPTLNLASLSGKRIGVYPNYDSDHILKALLLKAGIGEADVSVVPFPQLADWYHGDIDVFPSYLFNEPVEASTRGYGYQILDPVDFGVLFYSDTVVVTEAFFKSHREPIRRFMTALRAGWSFARSNPKAATEMMLALEQASILGRGGKQEAILEQEKANEVVRYLSAGDDLLRIDRAHWLKMVEELRSIGVVPQGYDPLPLIQAPEGPDR